MLHKVENLPSKIVGIKAEGSVTESDYVNVVIPMLKDAHEKGQRVLFLYEFGQSFTGFTAAAAVKDFSVGIKYLSLFDACAIVTNVDWLRKSTKLFAMLMPCPVEVFASDDHQKAVEWLLSYDAASKSRLNLDLRDDGVLVVRPQSALRKEDFARLSDAVNSWLEVHEKLNAIVIVVPSFPGWESFGSFLRHIEFVKSHHRKVKKVAIVADGILPDLAGVAASHFVSAEVRHFPFDQESDAFSWAS